MFCRHPHDPSGVDAEVIRHSPIHAQINRCAHYYNCNTRYRLERGIGTRRYCEGRTEET